MPKIDRINISIERCDPLSLSARRGFIVRSDWNDGLRCARIEDAVAYAQRELAAMAKRYLAEGSDK